MPTYEYECTACLDRFERFQKMTDPAVTECPDCGGSVRKVMHPPAISFKGSGFYVNDYKDSKGAGKTTADEPAPKSETKPEPKAETKPESKPDAVAA